MAPLPLALMVVVLPEQILTSAMAETVKEGVTITLSVLVLLQPLEVPVMV